MPHTTAEAGTHYCVPRLGWNNGAHNGAAPGASLAESTFAPLHLQRGQGGMLCVHACDGRRGGVLS